MKEKEEQQEIHQQQCKLQDMEAELKTREARSTEMEIKIQDMIDEAQQRHKQMLYENEQQEEIQQHLQCKLHNMEAIHQVMKCKLQVEEKKK